MPLRLLPGIALQTIATIAAIASWSKPLWIWQHVGLQATAIHCSYCKLLHCKLVQALAGIASYRAAAIAKSLQTVAAITSCCFANYCKPLRLLQASHCKLLHCKLLQAVAKYCALLQAIALRATAAIAYYSILLRTIASYCELLHAIASHRGYCQLLYTIASRCDYCKMYKLMLPYNVARYCFFLRAIAL